ncbi:MAG TPA: CpsD/CapB family tyrosine-protein kinase, partial [Myxococcota bacterium]|nr:CpsD/CapB family tyrosine-protein kinase [Myxococcota bacterium]
AKDGPPELTGAPAPLAPRNPAIPDAGPPPAPLDPVQPPVAIERRREGFWQARAVYADRPGAVAERFRHLAVRVRRELDKRDGRTLIVASALREEGKTVTSCNLALALASMASERRIALLDLDLRRPSVARALDVTPRLGIERVLRGSASLGSARIPTDIPSLDLYLAAEPTRHAHELLATGALARVLAELREQYAVVVTDTPPVLLVPDVPLIAPHFDACMLVARVGKTARSNFRDMLSLLPREKLIGGFLNQVRAASHATDYGYYLGDDEEDDR